MTGLPDFPCPDGFRVRVARAGDEKNWARIEVAAGEFPDMATAQARCRENYGPFGDTMKDTCYFIETVDGTPIGTASASSDPFDGELRGRVSSVGMLTEYQGRGLSKPLLSAVTAQLAREGYASAFLGTQTTSWRAIGLYRSFGFEPVLTSEGCRQGWLLVEEVLGCALLGDEPASAVI